MLRQNILDQNSPTVRILLSFVFAQAIISTYFSLTPASAASLSPYTTGKIEIQEIVTPDFSTITFSDSYLLAKIRGPSPTQLDPVPKQRLHFANVVDASSVDLSIKILDSNGDIIETYSKQELALRREFWTGTLFASAVYVVVAAEEPPVGFSFKIDKRVVPARPGAPKSIIGENNIEPLHKYKDNNSLISVAGAVARITYVYQFQELTCSGFMVSATTMLTNAHCIPHPSICDDSNLRAWFGYESSPGNVAVLPKKVFKCKSIPLPPNQELDFAVIELNGSPGEIFGTVEMADSTFETDKLILVHHAEGGPKVVSIQDCSIVGGRGNSSSHTISHSCDSLSGSSGAPVFSSNLKVVGLHFYGHGTDYCDFCENQATKIEVIKPYLPK